MAEGIAGLALSAVSVTALFSTCVECFDIVVAVKDFSEDYEQLCALFSLQRARFGLWGESVGLIPNPNDGCRLQYDKNLDRPDIRPGVERMLNNIKTLLEEAGRVDDRYGLKGDISQGSELSSSKGIDIFKASFDRFKSRIRKHQKDTSAWKVTRWAIHDAQKFETVIGRLEKFVDGLESITKSLGLLQQQHTRLRQEIESISDMESLRLLRDASSHASSQLDISDTASRRLITVAESVIEQQSIHSNSIATRTIDSFITANSKPSAAFKSLDEDPPIPGAWPASVKSGSKSRDQRMPPPVRRTKGQLKMMAQHSCEQCLEEHYKCISTNQGSCQRCTEVARLCSFSRDMDTVDRRADAEIPAQILKSNPASEFDNWVPSDDLQRLSQNQRLLSKLLEGVKRPAPLTFATGDARYGEQLAIIKKEDEDYWLNHSGRILGHANRGSSAAKRMFLELRNIRHGKVPFVSAVPLNDSLNEILASLEGPPETPYEGGVFWITVKLSDNDPFGPPLMRFHTRVYHPNISPRGHICADYSEKWNTFLSAGKERSGSRDTADSWYTTKSTDVRWSLGAVLTALCGLLATPDVDDPLVPEIAQIYLENYESYCENARLYTRKFATRKRPEYTDLLFVDQPLQSLQPDTFKPTSSSLSGSESDSESLNSKETRLRESFDARVSPTLQTLLALDAKSLDGLHYPLHHYIYIPLLYKQWNAHRTRPRTLHTIDLEVLLQYALDQLKNRVGHIDYLISFEIYHALLEKITISYQYPPQLDQPTYSLFRNIAKRELISYFERQLKGATIHVRGSRTGYEIEIVVRPAIGMNTEWTSGKGGAARWRFVRNWNDFEILNESITQGQYFAIWGYHGLRWCDGEPSSGQQSHVEPNPSLVCPLLEVGLQRLIRFKLDSLLGSAKFLAFIRPIIGANRSAQNFRKFADEARVRSPCNYSQFSIASFVPSMFFLGTPVEIISAMDGKSDYVEFNLHLDREQKVWALVWDRKDLQDSLPIPSIDRLVTHSNEPFTSHDDSMATPPGPNIFSILYHVDGPSITRIQRSVGMKFEDETQLRLWSDMLRGLQRIRLKD